MDRYWRGHTPTALLGFMLLAVAYTSLLYTFETLTGEIHADGVIGIVLGLYVCSHPASNVLDLLFVEGGAGRHRSSDERGIAWYALNLFVLIAGWFAVLIGITRFTT